MNTSVYLLVHTHVRKSDRDIKVLGVYSTRVSAEAAIARLKGEPGFSESPTGFSIHKLKLDEYSGGGVEPDIIIT